jgi:methionyl aminopeptidase
MVNQGTSKVSTERDGWTVVTNDRKLSAQFEHTVAVTRNGVDVLTMRRDETPMLGRRVDASGLVQKS